MSDYPQVLKKSRTQVGEPSYYRRRGPSDGQLDPNQTLRAQFNLLRVSDYKRYPAWLEMAGTKYNLLIEKVKQTLADKGINEKSSAKKK